MIRVSFLSVITVFVLFTNIHAAIVYQSQTISKDTVWENEVIISGKVVFDRKTTLKIMPGTKIFFKKVDDDNDGLSESTIIINGNIIAEGTHDRPIYFTSLEDKKDWGDWKEVQINHAKGFVLSNCIVEYSEFGFHIHFSEGEIKNSIFRKNGDATRLGNSLISFTNNLFEYNTGKALNFTNCKLIFKKNTVRNNREGIFVFEKTGDVTLEHNNIYDNKVNVKTGDFFKGSLKLGKNYISDTSHIQSNIIFDVAETQYMGILPNILDAYIHKVIETGGFIDGGLSRKNKDLFFTSFDGYFYKYSIDQNEVTRINIGEFMDCKPLIADKYVIISDWSGKVYAFDIENGEKKWQIMVDKSLLDDHRMPSPTLFGNKVVIARPDGKVYFLEPLTGKVLKKFIFEDEFRATPYVFDDQIIFAGSKGTLITINLQEEIKTVRLEASFYSSPILLGQLFVIVDKEGKLYLFDKDLNIKKLILLNAAFRHQSPVVMNNKLYLFSLNGHIFEFANDEVKLKRKLDLIFTATPVVINNNLVVPTFCGNLLFYSNEREFIIGNFGEIQFEPFYSDGFIYLGTRSNKLYVIKPW